MTTNTTTTDTPGQRRKPGRPRIHTEPRQEVRVSLPVALVEAMRATGQSYTALVEQAVRQMFQTRHPR